MSKWDFIYKTTLLNLLKKGKINPANAPATARAISVAIYLFSFVYEPLVRLKLKIKTLANIHSNGNKS